MSRRDKFESKDLGCGDDGGSTIEGEPCDYLQCLDWSRNGTTKRPRTCDRTYRAYRGGYCRAKESTRRRFQADQQETKGQNAPISLRDFPKIRDDLGGFPRGEKKLVTSSRRIKVIYVPDTHALVWYLTADRRLGKGARSALASVDNGSDHAIIPVVVLAEVMYLEESCACQ